jgi:hypothetical protein
MAKKTDADPSGIIISREMTDEDFRLRSRSFTEHGKPGSIKYTVFQLNQILEESKEVLKSHGHPTKEGYYDLAGIFFKAKINREEFVSQQYTRWPDGINCTKLSAAYFAKRVASHVLELTRGFKSASESGSEFHAWSHWIGLVENYAHFSIEAMNIGHLASRALKSAAHSKTLNVNKKQTRSDRILKIAEFLSGLFSSKPESCQWTHKRLAYEVRCLAITVKDRTLIEYVKDARKTAKH